MLVNRVIRFSHLRKIFCVQKAALKTSCASLTRTIQQPSMSGESMKGLSLTEVVDNLNKFAPLSLAESWDNVGLLVEPFTEKPIRNILLTNDLTEEVMQESINKNIDLIISYHPPIFQALKRITKSSYKERIVAACLENRIAVYSPHTSWDAIHGGVCDWLADAFGNYIQTRAPLVEAVSNNEFYTVTVLGSSEALDKIHQEVLKPSSINYISKRIKCNENEIFTINCTEECLQKLKNADCIILGAVQSKNEKSPNGMGRMLHVSNLNIGQCVELIKKHTGLPFVRLSVAGGKTKDSEVLTIALVPGSGGSLLKTVKADLFVTGEMFHHDIFDAYHKGTSVILTNHSESERGFLVRMKDLLIKTYGNNVKVFISTLDRDPLTTV